MAPFLLALVLIPRLLESNRSPHVVEQGEASGVALVSVPPPHHAMHREPCQCPSFRGHRLVACFTVYGHHGSRIRSTYDETIHAA
jgi:hypothetical protein